MSEVVVATSVSVREGFIEGGEDEFPDRGVVQKFPATNGCFHRVRGEFVGEDSAEGDRAMLAGDFVEEGFGPRRVGGVEREKGLPEKSAVVIAGGG